MESKSLSPVDGLHQATIEEAQRLSKIEEELLNQLSAIRSQLERARSAISGFSPSNLASGQVACNAVGRVGGY